MHCAIYQFYPSWKNQLSKYSTIQRRPRCCACGHACDRSWVLYADIIICNFSITHMRNPHFCSTFITRPPTLLFALYITHLLRSQFFNQLYRVLDIYVYIETAWQPVLACVLRINKILIASGFIINMLKSRLPIIYYYLCNNLLVFISANFYQD